MERSTVGRKLVVVRERRMWTQARLANEAGVSPTTVSGIESGRISRPHFGTLRKLARALQVEPNELIVPSGPPGSEGLVEQEKPAPLSLEWARSVGEEEFEHEVEEASMEELESFSEELREERGRLQRLYVELPESSERRRIIKRQIRQVSAQSGSVSTSIMFHRGEDFDEGVITEKTAQQRRIEGGPSKLTERTVALANKFFSRPSFREHLFLNISVSKCPTSAQARLGFRSKEQRGSVRRVQPSRLRLPLRLSRLG